MTVELANYGSRAADVSPGTIDTPLRTETSVCYYKGERKAVMNRPVQAGANNPEKLRN